MRIVCISDTHEQHQFLTLPAGDMLIHAGDLTWNGDTQAVGQFLDWFERQPHRYKIFIAGNHDSWFEGAESLGPVKHDQKFIYLHNDGCEIEGLKIWGSPYTPTFGNCSFMADRGDAIAKIWNKIPTDTDILITHGPPLRILDSLESGLPLGCWDLWSAVSKIKPTLHVFGNIHGGYGQTEREWEDSTKTIFVNASVCDQNYDPINAPIVIDL